ncbi:hypothetical protein [Brevundimonas vesicularis]|uniref:hypothetical protein n=1 Tax=Brevundimonas vesicularis TaxID=41276 RepID=UPI00384F3F92
MIRTIGRIAIVSLGVAAMRAGAELPWWADVALIVIGVTLIGLADRDRREG